MKDFNEDLCMRHSYNLLLGKKTLDQLIEETTTLYVMFNTGKKIVTMQDEIYDILFDYFTYT